MTSSFRDSLAELDDALAVERDAFDRLRFRLVVMRLIREGGNVSDREEAQRRLEQAVSAVQSSAAPHLRMIEELAGRSESSSSAFLRLVDVAPEPYRTMLVDHVAWFTGLAAELESEGTLEWPTTARADEMTRELEDVLHRAARGALSGGVGTSLARQLRAGSAASGHTKRRLT